LTEEPSTSLLPVLAAIFRLKVGLPRSFFSLRAVAPLSTRFLVFPHRQSQSQALPFLFFFKFDKVAAPLLSRFFFARPYDPIPRLLAASLPAGLLAFSPSIMACRRALVPFFPLISLLGPPSHNLHVFMANRVEFQFPPGPTLPATSFFYQQAPR